MNCGRCKFWVQDTPSHNEPSEMLDGECHRNPPMLLAIARGGVVRRYDHDDSSRIDSYSDVSTRWPRTAVVEFCGEFKHR